MKPEHSFTTPFKPSVMMSNQETVTVSMSRENFVDLLEASRDIENMSIWRNLEE